MSCGGIKILLPGDSGRVARLRTTIQHHGASVLSSHAARLCTVVTELCASGMGWWDELTVGQAILPPCSPVATWNATVLRNDPVQATTSSAGPSAWLQSALCSTTLNINADPT